ncbi:MAG: ribbon-helix-helix protein, CopG family [Actinobacteria bacterium]|nr:ribbon-helix-helix protein, CopG family [Actinomycetota bacterium]MCG2808253.1 ribbon-helix-helix protein, CopG family [Coriobacteriia bacterium]
MAVEKFSISLPEELVSDLDALADVSGLTRSAMIREATATYVVERKSAQFEAKRRTRIDDALAGLDVVASQWGDDEHSGLEYLSEIRGEGALGDLPRGPEVADDE